VDLLKRYVREKRMLLLLDNVEHVTLRRARARRKHCSARNNHRTVASIDRHTADVRMTSRIRNYHDKDGKSPADFRRLAAETGFTTGAMLNEGVKAGDIVAWLKQDFDLRHGQTMAIYALLKGSKSEDSE
jgi:hypothetical protein